MRVKVDEGMSQNEIVLRHLRENPDGITPWDAMNMYGIMRLGARVWELKDHGYCIEKHTVQKKRGKKTVRYARYILKEGA